MSKYPIAVFKAGEFFKREEFTEKEEEYFDKLVNSKGYELLRRLIVYDVTELSQSLMVERDPTAAAELRGGIMQGASLIEKLDAWLPKEEEVEPEEN